MGLTGDFAALAKLERSVAELARSGSAAQAGVLRPVVREVREVLRDQFARGVAPDGSAHRPTTKGEPALVSRKLPQAVTGQPITGGLAFELRIAWLDAHQEGHVFPSRSSKGGQALRFVKGRLVREARFFRATSGRTVVTGAHQVGARVLPARPIYPTGAMPPRWEQAVERGVSLGLKRWHDEARGSSSRANELFGF